MKNIVLLFFHFLSLSPLFGQLPGRMVHALQIGAADNAVLLKGAKSQFANPAGLLSSAPKWDFDLAVHQRYHSDIRSISGVVSRSFDQYGIGIGVSRYGIDEFNESQLSFSFARRIGSNSFMAVQTHLYQFRIEGLGQREDFDMSLGFWHSHKNQWTFSLFLLNPLLLTSNEDERLGKIDLSVGYVVGPQLEIYSSTSKSWGNKISFRPGLKYRPVEQFSVLAAYNSFPSSMNFGLIFNPSLFQVSLGYHAHPFLGNALALGFGYSIQ